MPITQSRLLRILEAAESYQQRYRVFYDSIYNRCAQISRGQLTPEQAFRDLTDELTLMGLYSSADATISEERTRYRLTHSRNATERTRLSTKRHPISIDHHHSPTPPPLSAPSTPVPLPTDPITRALLTANTEDEAFDGLADLAAEFTTTPAPPTPPAPPLKTPLDIHTAIDRALRESTTTPTTTTKE